ncbi:unnamed protein product [Caenorhabditis bovis]|uniref:Uncharacterized protein n=1 Tax=Caenorhabditis bovis TaxID=2654633 RepID=A0A8S1ET94_9PELO|nr:unnamed protein product [Caenorhabditis bovis]
MAGRNQSQPTTSRFVPIGQPAPRFVPMSMPMAMPTTSGFIPVQMPVRPPAVPFFTTNCIVNQPVGLRNMDPNSIGYTNIMHITKYGYRVNGKFYPKVKKGTLIKKEDSLFQTGTPELETITEENQEPTSAK